MSFRRLLAALLFSSGIFLTLAGPALAAGVLTLGEALDQAFLNRRELAVFRADLNAAEVKLQQAGLPPNPELGIEWDNLGGDFPDGDGRETTVSLSQPFELGGKPLARKNLSQAGIARLERERETAWQEIAREVRTAFFMAQAARERLELQLEAERIATELAAITRERVMAGELAATEEIRAEARKAETMAETQRQKRLMASAGLDLAIAMADSGDAAITPAGRLSQEVPIPERQAIFAEAEKSPVLAMSKSESGLAAAGLALEQANAWADPSLSLAVREIPDQDGRAVTIGFSIPLPIFQKNQTAIAEARAASDKARLRGEAAEKRLRTELIKARAELAEADQEARTLRNEVLSRATEAAEAVREGFRAGKFRYSDVLEASQSLVSVKFRHLDAILDLNLAAADLDYLLGRPPIPSLSLNSSSVERSIP